MICSRVVAPAGALGCALALAAATLAFAQTMVAANEGVRELRVHPDMIRLVSNESLKNLALLSWM